MPRLFIDPRAITADTVTITGPDAQYLTRVMRLGANDAVDLLDGSGALLRAVIRSADPGAVVALILEREEAPEPPVAITLYQGMPKGDKLELVIQKATELGVSRIVPVPAVRSVVQLKGDRLEAKLGRWQKIAQEAAEQCERGKVPVVDVPEALKDIALPDGTLAYVLSERVSGPSLPKALPPHAPMAIALFVGPEGGWAPEELDQLRKLGVTEVTLGKRILRTETAGLAALAMLMSAYELD